MANAVGRDHSPPERFVSDFPPIPLTCKGPSVATSLDIIHLVQSAVICYMRIVTFLQFTTYVVVPPFPLFTFKPFHLSTKIMPLLTY